MPKSQSPLLYPTRTGELRGFTVQERDREVLRQLTRWYALSTPALARRMHMNQKHIWSPYFGGSYAAFLTKGELDSSYRKVRDRLLKMKKIVEDTPSGIGPFVHAGYMGTEHYAWYATPLGARECGLQGWVRSHSINQQSFEHAMAASDIGMQFESYGWTVASERELLRSVTVQGDMLETNLTSMYRADGSRRDVQKRPDLAIMSPDRSRYIAVEIERNKYRALSNYVEKMHAYAGNPCIDAVWYVCVDENTRSRVIEAAERVFERSPHARVRIKVADQQHGFWHLPRFMPDDNPERFYDPQYRDDLKVLTERTTRRGILYQGD